MKIKKKFYVVVDDTDMLWEKAFDFEDSGDYYEKNLSEIEIKDLMTYEEAEKWKDELVREITTLNNIYFEIKSVELNVL